MGSAALLDERSSQIHRKGREPFTLDCNKHSLAGAVSQRAFVFCGSRAVLISGVGEPPYEILSKSGAKPVEASGFIEEGLKVIYQHRKTALLRGRRNPCSDETCSGSGSGRS
jgi:hypothetical protein